jgi:hypothetical protein
MINQEDSSDLDLNQRQSFVSRLCFLMDVIRITFCCDFITLNMRAHQLTDTCFFFSRAFDAQVHSTMTIVTSW